jgi:hypothetical protein
MKTTKDKIVELLKDKSWYANHEIGDAYHARFGMPICASDNNIASRLPELAKEGVIYSRFRQGTNYKEWHIVEMPKNTQETPQEGVKPICLLTRRPKPPGAIIGAKATPSKAIKIEQLDLF